LSARKNLSQHFEYLVKMRATSSTLFVRVKGKERNADLYSACQHWGNWKRGNGKRQDGRKV